MPLTRALCLSSQGKLQHASADMHNPKPAVDGGEASRAGTRSWRQTRQPDALHAWQESTQHCCSAVPRRAGVVKLDRSCLPACEQMGKQEETERQGLASCKPLACCGLAALSVWKLRVVRGCCCAKHHLPASTLSVTGCLHTSLPLLLQVHLSDVALPPIKQWKGPASACTAQLAVAECAASPALAFSVWVGAQGDCGMFAKASCAVCRAKSA